jgi:hypothetical protein
VRGTRNDEHTRNRPEAETVGGQTCIESQVALAQLERVETDIREKADQFEECEAPP